MQSSAVHGASGRHSVDLEPVEYTPLLAPDVQSSRLRTYASIAVLATVLVAGVLIGVYLLVLQSRAEDIIPEEPTVKVLMASGHFDSNAYFDQARPKYVVIKAGNTQECYDVEECVGVLDKMQNNTVKDDISPFNLLSMSDGKLLYDHKWNTTHDPDTFSIALIGNFTDDRIPKQNQVDAITNFITYHDMMGHFDQTYVVMVKNTNRRLLDSLQDIPHFCADCTPT